MGAAGPAIMFVMLFAASIMIGVCVLAFAARCTLVVFQETAVGQDEVVWPNEPYQDWLAHAAQFIELLGIWLAPSALAARLLREVWLPDAPALRVLLLAGPGLWLFFPIGLMSSLSAESRWVPFRWTIVVRVLRVAPAAMIFYFLTALLLGAGVVPWYYALFGGKGWVLLAAAPIGAVVLFTYARLLGRLAWIIQRLPSTQRAAAKPKSEKPPPQTTKPRGKKKRKPRAEVEDPWAIPEEEERAHKTSKRFPWAEQPPPPKPGYHVPRAEDIEGYGIAEGTAAPETPAEKPPRSRFAMSPEEYEPIEMRQRDEPAPQEPAEPVSELFAEQVRQRIAERTRNQPTLPPHPFVSGVYGFFFSARCFPSWLALSFAFLVLGGIVHQMLAIGQALFHW
jgi:hypothetical protein